MNKILTEEARERNLKAQRRWAERNPEKIKAAYLKNRVKILRRQALYRLENPGKLAERQKKWRIANAEHWHNWNRNYALKRKYGISQKDFEDFLSKQNFRCAICQIKHEDLSYGLYVDHNHKTGKVRALLCNGCNVLVGFCKEDIHILDKIKAYIIKHSV